MLPLAPTTVLESDAGLFDFQTVQGGPCDLLLRSSMRGTEAELAPQRPHRVLGEFLESQGAVGVHVHCRSGETGRAGCSGKVLRVVSAPP